MVKKILSSARESVCVDSGTRTKAAITKSCPSACRLDKTFVMNVDVISKYDLFAKSPWITIERGPSQGLLARQHCRLTICIELVELTNSIR